MSAALKSATFSMYTSTRDRWTFFLKHKKRLYKKKTTKRRVCFNSCGIHLSFCYKWETFNWYAQQKWFSSFESLKTTLKRLDMLNLIGLSDYNRHLFFAHSTQIVCFCSLKISLKYALVMHLAWKWQQTSHLHSKKNKVFVKKY